DAISAQGTGSSPYSGRGTWFTDKVGSCGTPFDTNDMIVAMNAHQMGGTSQCGKTVKIHSGGKTVTARVTDTCPAQFCAPGSLDLSQAVFKQFAPLTQGVVQIQWEF
ncbi:RlpA-like double-psi beta-barrel-protein domain-containing protein-containing protein, partial [Lobosporangium transversale]